MRVVLVSSPGRGAEPHWSQAAAADLARELCAAGVDVEWFDVTAPAAPAAAAPAGVRLHRYAIMRPTALHRVEAGMHHMALERDLARSLRRDHAPAVVHLGAGAGGSPNVLWLAERMGSRVFAVVRTAEVVCHRGDLVDASGIACERIDEAAACQACCATSRLRRPGIDEFRNRWDLLLGGLFAAAAVFVPETDAAERLLALGVARRQVTATHGPQAIAARVLARG